MLRWRPTEQRSGFRCDQDVTASSFRLLSVAPISEATLSGRVLQVNYYQLADEVPDMFLSHLKVIGVG